MKRLGSILLVAGCLSGTLQPYAQEYPASPVSDTPDELSLKARAAARTLLFKEPEPLSLQWLREEVNPLLRARRKLRQAMQVRAEKAAATAVPMVPKRDMSKEVGLWRIASATPRPTTGVRIPTVRWTPGPCGSHCRATREPTSGPTT